MRFDLLIVLLIFAATVLAATPILLDLGLPVVMLVFALVVLVVLPVVIHRRKRRDESTGGENRRNSLLREYGIEPLPHSQKMQHFLGFTVAWALLSSVVVVNLGYVWTVWIFLLVVSLSIGLLFAGLAFFVGEKAEEAGRGWISFFWLTMLLSPLVTWIIVSVLKPASVSSSKNPDRPAPLAGKLAELKDLQEKGLISPDEFEEAKKRLLGI
jgi:membrane protein implicated in regulation of membrane protease activity